MHRRERGTDVEADERGLAGAERAARLDDLVERLAAHELGPQADAAVVFLGAVDLHDVLVAQARQAAGFLHERARARSPRTSPRRRPECSSFSATSRWSSESQARKTSQDVPLPMASRRTRRPQRRPSGVAGVASGVSVAAGRDAAMEGGDAVDEAQVADDAAVAARSPASTASQSTGLPSATDAARSASARSSALNRRVPTRRCWQFNGRITVGSRGSGVQDRFKVHFVFILGLRRSLGFEPLASGAHATPRGGRPTPAA